MKFTLPTDCGNSPRAGVVNEFTLAWVAGDTETLNKWLADGFTWTVLGTESSAGAHGEIPAPPVEANQVEVLATITHGRLAACDGYITDDAARIDFCHTLRFSNTAKTGKVVEVRTYLSS